MKEGRVLLVGKPWATSFLYLLMLVNGSTLVVFPSTCSAAFFSGTRSLIEYFFEPVRRIKNPIGVLRARSESDRHSSYLRLAAVAYDFEE